MRRTGDLPVVPRGARRTGVPRYGWEDGHGRHTELMAVLATVRRWNTHRAWGVLDSPETPGGCWAHLSSIARPGPWDVQPGDEFVLEWEHARQDGFAYRAVRMWPAGSRSAPIPAGSDGP